MDSDFLLFMFVSVSGSHVLVRICLIGSSCIGVRCLDYDGFSLSILKCPPESLRKGIQRDRHYEVDTPI